MKAAWRLGYRLAAAATVALAVGSPAFGGDGLARYPAAAPAFDIEIAFDTTGTMAPSIERAEQDASFIVSAVKDFVADAHFAVVAFRDPGYPAPEYELLQPMTSDTAAIQAALGRLRATDSNHPGNVPSEAYNLVFRRSYSDAAIGWRPQARKVVVVVGDAEPHSAGRVGISGCKDETADPHDLRTDAELAAMKRERRTLVLIRQVTGQTTASLECYESLAARAYDGGAARDSGRGNIAGPIVGLLRSAVAPVRLEPDLGVARPGGTVGYTVRVSNPNTFALTVERLAVTLPAGLTYRRGSATGPLGSPQVAARTLQWTLTSLAPSQRLAVHFAARAGNPGRRVAAAELAVRLPEGEALSSGARGVVVVGAVKRLDVTFGAAAGARKLHGTLRLGTRRGPASVRRAGRVAGGTATLMLAGGRRAAFRLSTYRLPALGSPTHLVLEGSVVSARGLACGIGTPAVLELRDANSLLGDGRTADRITLRVRGECGGAWTNAGGGSAAVAARGG